MPDISIITPSLNQGRFIARTIDSVVAQDLGAIQLEYVVVDGGSSDETLDLLRRHSDRIRWISEHDAGQADAVNKGLAMTTGEIVGWLNSDDVYYPGALRAVCQFFDEHHDVDVVYGDASHVDQDDAVIEPYYTERWDIERLRDVCYLCQPAVFFRRRVVRLAGALDTRLHFCMDYEYWLRLAQSGAAFAYLRQTLAGSRLYPETKTLGSRVRVHTEINSMLRARLGRVPERWIFNYAHVLLEERTAIHPTQRIRFTLGLSLLALYASLRWNRSVSSEIIRTTSVWVGHSVRTSLHAALIR
jgi:glycosyltransferase involved in cell wall biosynthesis